MSCPHPQKIQHATKAAALEAIADLYRNGKGNPDLNAYQCPGPGPQHWHVGHSAVHFRRRIGKALQGGRDKSTTYARNRRTKR